VAGLRPTPLTIRDGRSISVGLRLSKATGMGSNTWRRRTTLTVDSHASWRVVKICPVELRASRLRVWSVAVGSSVTITGDLGGSRHERLTVGVLTLLVLVLAC